jgi:hypothetical protein
MVRFGRWRAAALVLLVGLVPVACRGRAPVPGVRAEIRGPAPSVAPAAGAGPAVDGAGSLDGILALAAGCEDALAGMVQAGAATAGGDEVGQLRAIAAAAPEAIRHDLTVVVDGIAGLPGAGEAVEGRAGHDPEPPPGPDDGVVLGPATTAVAPGLLDPALRAAAERVTRWFEVGCTGG